MPRTSKGSIPKKQKDKNGWILGLDVSTTIIGWSMFHEKKLVSHGVFYAKKTDYVAKRLITLKAQFIDLLTRAGDKGIVFDAAIMEEGVYCRDQKGSFSLGGSQLMVEMILYERNIPVDKVNVNTWKKALSTNKKALREKSDVAKQVFEEGIIKHGGVVQWQEEGVLVLNKPGLDGKRFIYYDETDSVGMTHAWLFME